MGNSGSSDVTLEREDDKYVLTGDGIKLSPALLDRMLSQETENENNEDVERVRKAAADVIVKERQKLEEVERVATATRELLQEREKQMTDLVETWKDKLENEKQKHKNFYDLTIQEFEDAVNQTESKLRKPSLKPICESFRDSVLQCYAENPKKILNCSKTVAEFTKCVENTKQDLLNRN
ncbi:MICOS complex subunit mic25-a-like [Styela clava]